MGRSYAGVLGPLAFLTVIARGLVHQSGIESTLLSAALYLFVFGAIGYVVGQWADWIVWDSIRSTLANELAGRAAGRTTSAKNT